LRIGFARCWEGRGRGGVAHVVRKFGSG
jgi:hypothetical protein